MSLKSGPVEPETRKYTYRQWATSKICMKIKVVTHWPGFTTPVEELLISRSSIFFSRERKNAGERTTGSWCHACNKWNRHLLYYWIFSKPFVYCIYQLHFRLRKSSISSPISPSADEKYMQLVIAQIYNGLYLQLNIPVPSLWPWEWCPRHWCRDWCQ